MKVKLNNDSNTITDALALFHSECERWLNELIKLDENPEQVMTILCETMREVFHTPPEKIKSLVCYLKADRIEATIKELSEELGYKYSYISTPKKDILANWVLSINSKNRKTILLVELNANNYIHIDCLTHCWNLITYKFSVLESTIWAWATGHIV